MGVESLEGAAFGPHRYRTCHEKVAEYVAATGDDPERWEEAAPPSFAGALLFVVAPDLLANPEIGADADRVIHGDQSFVWHRSIPVEEDLEVSGTVERVRTRSGVHFVAFRMEVTMRDGPLVDGWSTFLMSGTESPAGAASEGGEPPAAEGSIREPATSEVMPGQGEPLPPLHRSASRADLVRYAGASRDWNPVHWDHETAVAAGLAGVVVHGLLQSAWMSQAAARHAPGTRPLASARFRYRAPLRPAIRAEVGGVVEQATALEMNLSVEKVKLVSATIELAS